MELISKGEKIINERFDFDDVVTSSVVRYAKLYGFYTSLSRGMENPEIQKVLTPQYQLSVKEVASKKFGLLLSNNAKLIGMISMQFVGKYMMSDVEIIAFLTKYEMPYEYTQK